MYDSGFSSRVVASLVTDGVLSSVDAGELLAEAEKSDLSVDHLLMRRGICEESDLLPAVGAALNVEVLPKYGAALVDMDAFKRLPATFWLDHAALPTLTQNGAVAVTVGLPYDRSFIEEVAFHVGETVSVSLAIKRQLRDVARGLITPETDVTDKIHPHQDGASDLDEGGVIARAVEVLVEDAVALQASDIHLDDLDQRLNIRFRVNGVLQARTTQESLDARAVLARLKLMANLNVTEKRMPQDGSCQIRFAGRLVELRLSTLPTLTGESMVCRILDPKTLRKDWSELGFRKEISDPLQQLLERPAGLLIVSGPTGAGKSTTLYALLRHLNNGKRKILTVEDPIEQRISGVVQVQVNPHIGLGFGHVLRTTLRHDPDIIMIGEIRDEETAEIACRAALIGRLVLATVHASSADMVRERLVNLGVKPYLIDDVLIGALSQRLDPNICSSCKGAGCQMCANTGRVGRVLTAQLWQP